jgi:hypothetical protein
MRAIYLNLDPYLAAFAAWLKANPPLDPETGERATPPPTFAPLTLAVTIPLGETAAILWACEGHSSETEPNFNKISVDGQTIYVIAAAPGAEVIGNAIAFDQTLGLSALAPGMKYAVKPVNGDSAEIEVSISSDDFDLPVFTLTVLVRREQASGPVDLVDFTPPASAIAAGTDLKGCKFDGNEIVAAKTTGALSAPAGA